NPARTEDPKAILDAAEQQGWRVELHRVAGPPAYDSARTARRDRRGARTQSSHWELTVLLSFKSRTPFEEVSRLSKALGVTLVGAGLKVPPTVIDVHVSAARQQVARRRAFVSPYIYERVSQVRDERSAAHLPAAADSAVPSARRPSGIGVPTLVSSGTTPAHVSKA